MKNSKAITFFLIIVLLIFIGLFLKQCNKPVVYVPVNVVKEMAVRDSFRVVIKYHDSTRLHHLNKWRTIINIKDSTPCYTEIRNIIQACDTVIKYDSILILSLNGLVKQDSVIINKLFNKVADDSLVISKLNKRLKRQKLITKAAFFLGFGSGGALGIQIKK